MEYIKLGNSGLDISRICLGCMGFGDPVNWQHKWVIEKEIKYLEEKYIPHAIVGAL